MAGERLVERYKEDCKSRGRKYRIHDEAVEAAVADLKGYGIEVTFNALNNYVRRSKKDRRKRM